ncbi:nodulation protein NfeD [Thermodesulfobacteriota bacterium]
MNGHPKKSALIFLFLFPVLSFYTFIGPLNGEPLKKIYVIPVSGTVDPGMAAFIKRSLEAPSNVTGAICILEMDTFGGRVDSALQIVDTLLGASNVKTIAYVKSKAISAGALIALACNELVMKQNTTIGDCAPITYSKEGPKALGEKFQSPLRAKFRALAKRNNYPETLAEAMVTAEMVVYAVEMNGKTVYMDSREFEDLNPTEKEKVSSKKTVVDKGELLTMDDTEALQFGFSRMSVTTVDDMIQKMGIRNYDLTRVEESWSEAFVRFIGSITPLLLMIGLAALWTEIKSPGFGVPGIIGITFLALVFLGQYLVGLADYTELLLLVMGILLLGFELFVIPGFGIAGISGLLLITVGIILSLQDFVIPNPSLPWEGELLAKNIIQVFGAFFLSVVLALLVIRYLLPRLSVIVDGPYLETTLEASRADSVQLESIEVGDIGIAVTFLRPSGKVKIKNEIFDVIAEGEFMEKDTAVEISAIRGNRIIVSRKPEDE